MVVVGGGYTGLWTAWHLLAADPEARVVVLEGGRCGHGPSGRNGGFVPRWTSARRAARRLRRRGRGVGDAARATVDAVGAWCEAEGVDALYRRGGELWSPRRPRRTRQGEAVDGTTVIGADAPSRRGRAAARPCSAAACSCRAAPPCIRRGSRSDCASGCAPAARRSSRAAGRSASARSRAAWGADPDRTRARAHGGAGGQRRHRLAPPAAQPPDRLLEPHRLHRAGPRRARRARLARRGGDLRRPGAAPLHAGDARRPDRLRLGRRTDGGGRPPARAHGGRPGIVSHVRSDLLRFFPQLEGKASTHAWGGPIDVSPTHLPAIVGLRGLPAWVAFGYTGNGVAPSHLFGRTLAALAQDRRDPVTRLPYVEPAPRTVPPEPLRIAGAAVIRRALARKEAAEEAGRAPDPISAGVAALPGLLGLHIVR